MNLFTTLYRKLAFILFCLLLVVGLASLLLLSYSSELYQQEVAQKLNRDLARQLVDSKPLLTDRQVNEQALQELFHWLMVINPTIEIYLLDSQGKILAYSAPEGRVKRNSLSLAPIKDFIAGSIELPLLGEDPRSLDKEKAFSAAAIRADGMLQGYLYVILGSEAYENVAQRISESFVLRAGAWILLGSLLAAMLFGLGGFALITRRLRLLSRMVQTVSSEQGVAGEVRYPVTGASEDEIDLLGRRFNLMADRIEQQVESLRRNDAQRREMIANISHDLRTPLTSLHGYIETLLLKDADLDEAQRHHYLAIANAQSTQLIRLVSELFELAKLDSCETLMNVEAFSLAELVQDVVNKFRLKANERGVGLEVDCAPSLPFAYGDIGLIQRVLDNLIENALRHTGKDGQVRVSLVSDQRQISVEITDNGCGIPSSELPHIFERFYRLDKSRETGARHAGLGLAIAKRILDLHNGIIWARSQADRGTTFGFRMAVHGEQVLPS